MTPTRTQSDLISVPETMLWTLHNRANEAMRSDTVLKDSTAVEIYKSIDYDYEESFGKPNPSHAIRSNIFDKEVSKYLEKYPQGTIVNLAEGLETQRYRFDNSLATWFSIDLPEAIRMREKFIQPDQKHIHIPLSATNQKWFDDIPQGQPPLITAQGLFMYIPEDVNITLFKAIKERFPGSVFIFDMIPKSFSEKTMRPSGYKITQSYTTPQMPWGLNMNKSKEWVRTYIDSNIDVEVIEYDAYPRGFWKYTMPILRNIRPLAHYAMPYVLKLRLSK
ncbi:MAG: class I SAM-dependent methyltransferase [Patescibacteria group bacterium]